MSYKHEKLATALGWKFNYLPGIRTTDDELTGWPDDNQPTDEELAQIVEEYEALPVVNAATERARKKDKLSKLPKTVEQLHKFIEEELL